MLDLPRYLLGVAEIAWLAGFAWLGGRAIRSRLLPSFAGAPAHLATVVIALALLVWTAEILGSFGLLEPVPYLIALAAVAVLCHALLRRAVPATEFAGKGISILAAIAFAIATLALVKFGLDVRSELGTGMTGFDSTWYHGPFAAGFFQGGDTWDLHFIAPQFLAWFYPANAEIFHAAGMLAFGRDVLSPLLNLGWFAGCLVACWCIGRPYRVAPWSLALGAIALSLPVLSDQAGEARNDIVGIFFLLAAVGVAVNAVGGRKNGQVGEEGADLPGDRSGAELGPAMVVGLAAGLAAGTKLNFLLPAAVLVLGMTFIAPAGGRWRALAAAGLAALAGGGYWYLRNLIHTGNPLPWFDHVGPIALPAPDQALGGREGHSVLGYLTDGSVWSDWFLPGLHGGLTIFWPLLAALAFTGLLLSLIPLRCSLSRNNREKEQRKLGGGDAALGVAGLAGLAAILAWLVAPTSASGPNGIPRGFESGLRYLAPALVLGLALLPATPPLRRRLTNLLPARSLFVAPSATKGERGRWKWGAVAWSLAAGAVAAAIAIGYPVQRHYLENRYANPTFAAPGLNAAFKWADDISNARIATTSTRQYPIYGTDLSNQVQYIGEEEPHGGFTAPTTCQQWRHLLNAGNYDYVITTRDRIERGKLPYPPATRWTEGPGVTPILRKPPTAVFKLTTPLDPSACP
jgi:hypothetical protein